MKNHSSILLFFLAGCLSLSGCRTTDRTDTESARNTLTGIGVMAGKRIELSDFDEIEFSSANLIPHNRTAFFNSKKPYPFLITYTQQPGAADMQLIVDKNLTDALLIRTKNRKLYIGTRNKMCIRPTRLEIRLRSGDLKKIQVTGPVETSFANDLRTEQLAIVQMGSGIFRAPRRITAGRLDIRTSGSGQARFSGRIEAGAVRAEIAGSGQALLTDLHCRSVEGRVSGSGALTLSGEAGQGAYQVAGSGTIAAQNCRVDSLSSSVSGSGRINVYAVRWLKARVSGSGFIQYRGNPRQDFSVSGSGSIRSGR